MSEVPTLWAPAVHGLFPPDARRAAQTLRRWFAATARPAWLLRDLLPLAFDRAPSSVFTTLSLTQK